MKPIHEAVNLPNPHIQPLVHPLDLPRARTPFAIAWWLSALTLPTVFFGIAASLWAISNNYVTPILVPILIAVGAVLAQKWYLSEAWAYIPRKRHDTERRMPLRWSIAKSAASGLIFLAGLIALIQWFVDRNLSGEISAYAMGMGAAVLVIMIINLVSTLAAPTRLSSSLGRWASQLLSLFIVAAVFGYGYFAADANGTADRWAMTDVLAGAAMMFGVQVSLWLWKLIPTRKRTHGDRNTCPVVQR